MKSTSSTSSSSSREEKGKQHQHFPFPPRLTVSEPEDRLSVSGGSLGNISRKSSKTSLKSNNFDGNSTKDEIIASMIKDKMKELEAGEELVTASGESSAGLVLPFSSTPPSSTMLLRLDSTSSTQSQPPQSNVIKTNYSSDTEQKLLNYDQDSNLKTNDTSNMINKLIIDQRHQSSSVKKRHPSTTAAVELELETLSSGGHDINSKRSSREFKSGEEHGGLESDNKRQSLNDSSGGSSIGGIIIGDKARYSSPMIPTSSTRKYSRSHQKRFHRRFPSVDSGEKVIDWFNCALVADILLQGYLYISDNYFAFYSNIFGYKTSILTPVSDVVSVTKEKTAKIFPNAIGICTDEAKYVLGSFLSRESAYRLMHEVWRRTLSEMASIACLDQIRERQHEWKEMKILSDKHRQLTSTPSQEEDKVPESEEAESEESDELPSNEEGKRTSSKTGSPLLVGNVMKSTESIMAIPVSDPKRNGVFKQVWNAMYGWGRKSSQVLFVRHYYPSSLSSQSSQEATKKSLLTGITVALVLLFLSASILIFRANTVYTRLSYLTDDGYFSSQADSDGIVGESGVRTEARTLLITSHVKKIASSLQMKLNEVILLRQELDQLLKKPAMTTEDAAGFD